MEGKSMKINMRMKDGGHSSKHNRMAARGLRFLVVTLLITVWTGVASAQSYQIVNSQTSAVANNLTRTVTTVQEGGNSLNRFFMHRVVKTIPEQALRGTILLLPPLG